MFSFFFNLFCIAQMLGGRDTTVGELTAALDGVPSTREVAVCVDLLGEWRAPFPTLEERAAVFGYYAVDKLCVDEAVVLMIGGEVPL